MHAIFLPIYSVKHMNPSKVLLNKFVQSQTLFTEVLMRRSTLDCCCQTALAKDWRTSSAPSLVDQVGLSTLVSASYLALLIFIVLGTLAGVATLTASIKALPSTLKICGYSGLMLPVMEDLILSQRATENLFKLQDLLFFSAVCGVGLDTVPIPIASDPNTLANIYLDMAAMAFRLNKPLTCRLLPMELNAGDITQVSSPYLCNTKVFSLN